MRELFSAFAEYTAYGLEAAAVIVIISGGLRTMVIYFRGCLLEKDCFREISVSRIRLGHSLSLSLEFLIGADILKTAVAPTWQDIGQLAAIIAIRTVLNFFLLWELEKMNPQAADNLASK
jgi:uncharacterized membrane protein